ncbi:hypothetical protein AQUCO_00300302v1 [Aquilegia coerulea]|uniref:Protein CHUP1, chloroplastic n=1 Tax=Aquilegia coerulea TaxID=218851 RepID=A0A2G5EY85_AQUCA|nr:hypothetical protein AQUCO_00300302v1 [Aquilegia coerulea]
MKQEKNTSSEVTKVVSLSQSTTTPTSRLRASSLRTKDSPKPEVSPGGLKAAKPRSVVLTQDPKVRRSLGLNNKPKSGEDVMGSQKGREIEEVKILGRSGNRPMVEQFSRLRRRQAVVVTDPNCKRNEDESDREKKELLERVNSSEILVKSLQSEVLELKTQLDKLQILNVELESKNKQFVKDLAVAEAKISALSSQDQGEPAAEKLQTSSFKDVQKLIANKLENLGVNKNVIKEGSTVPKPSALMSNPVTKEAAVQQKVKPSSAPLLTMPPPPPPPPLPRIPSRSSTTKKAPTLVEFYHTLTKREGKKDAQGPGIPNNRMPNYAHNSIVGEIQNRSSHLLAIKSDIETKGEFIKLLIEKIHSTAYTDIEDVLQFVGWLDRELSSLADERAVLRHFNWPEKKADSMREAAIEYRDLKRLESEVSSYKDDSGVSCEVALKKIASLLDKSERSVQRLIKLRDSTILVYRDCKIPTDWMLDSGMVYKIKQASMNLAKIYMKRVSMELQSVRNSERESTQEALLLQGVRFAYRAHQFSGGLDSETMRAFEDIRQRVPMNVGGSRELLAGIRSQ